MKGEPSIYLRFVNAERNNIVHEYKVGFSYTPGGVFTVGTGIVIVGNAVATFNPSLKYVVPPFDNRPPLELVQEAIAWFDGVAARFEAEL